MAGIWAFPVQIVYRAASLPELEARAGRRYWTVASEGRDLLAGDRAIF